MPEESACLLHPAVLASCLPCLLSFLPHWPPATCFHFLRHSADVLQTCWLCLYGSKHLLFPTSHSQTCLSPILMERRSLLQLSVFAVLLPIRCLLKTQICQHKNDVVNSLCYLVHSCSPAFNFVLLVIFYHIWLFYIVLCFHSISLLRYHRGVSRHYHNVGYLS